MRYGLPHYVRTIDLRHRLIARHHPRCGGVFFSGKVRDYCPRCGRNEKVEEVSLLREGRVDALSVIREPRKGFEWAGNGVVGTVEIDVNGTTVKFPTEFTDIDITKGLFPVKEWVGREVGPTIRILDYNPDGALYYGAKFKPLPRNRSVRQKPFTPALVESPEPGIASIGISVPRYRTTAAEMARHFSLDAGYITRGLGVDEVTVPAWDQDTTTFAMDAALDALSRLPPEIVDTIGMIVVGTESKPYSVKPTATSVQHLVGAPQDIICYDAEFACIAAGMQIKPAMAMIRAGEIDTALIIGADVSQGAPGDPLDFDTGSGGACLVISRYNVILDYLTMNTHVGDHPDFARRKNHAYPFHGRAFTGHPSYFAFQEAAVAKALEGVGIGVDDVAGATFHQPNFNFVAKEVEQLGLDAPTRKARGLKPCVIGSPVIEIGNTYSAATIFGLASLVNEPAHDVGDGQTTTFGAGDIILTGWYGSGAAGGCALFRVSSLYPRYLEATTPFSEILDSGDRDAGKKYVDLLARYFAKEMIYTEK